MRQVVRKLCLTTTPIGVWGGAGHTRESFFRCGNLKGSVIGRHTDFDEGAGFSFGVEPLNIDQ